MHVLKFGGSSIGDPDRIESVIGIIKKRAEQGQRLSVIFSAYQGVTDQLILMGKMAEQGDENYKQLFNQIEERHISTADALISLKNRSALLTQLKILLNDLEEILYGVFLIRELTLKTLDYIQSFGERLSAYTISASLGDRGVHNTFIDSRLVIKTDNHFGGARVQAKISEDHIRRRFADESSVYIITGFIGSTDKEETTTLGRGGSDYSASIFGAALDAQEIEIWTDVDGVLTTDPGKVPEAFSIAQMTYEEAMELSHFGAKVIHPPTMQPALDKKLPIRILNTFNTEFIGTVISAEKVSNPYLIRGISSIDSVALLQIRGSGMVGSRGIAERIFGALARNNINIILISQASSEHSICLAILPEMSEKAETALREELKYEIHYDLVNEIIVEPDMAIIAVVGENMRHRKGIAGKVFQTLGGNGINISAIAQGSSELNISMVVARQDETRALNVLHRVFFSPERRTANLFLVGAGLVGGELLKQISEWEAKQSEDKKLHLSLQGICNTKKMLLNSRGIDPGNWNEALQKEGKTYLVDAYFSEMLSMSLPGSIMVDCTSNEKITDYYAALLEKGISIVTPNKIANTRSKDFYRNLKKHAKNGGSEYLYETTAGAGLPVIKTIRDLIDSGDDIIKIEGVLSGTMSYLFNNYNADVSFADLVRKARNLGYTEPDPRSDLSGLDVVRKLLILIRETGTAFEMNQIDRIEFLPESIRNAESLETFLALMDEQEELFREKYQKAAAGNKALRYMARFWDSKATVALEAVPATHPAYTLSGGENIVSITSRLYREYPLVIRGLGAGAEVTAAGVLSDILKIGATAP